VDFRAKGDWGNQGVYPRRGLPCLLHEAASLQYPDALLQDPVTGQNLESLSHGYCAQENVHRTALDPMLPAQIEQARRFHVIAGCDFFIAEWVKKLLRLRELRLIPDAGQYLLPDGADDGCAAVLNGFTELCEHLLLVCVDLCLIPAPKRK
jgi:hypothetical protein